MIYMVAVAGILAFIAVLVIYIDPLFHYHKPFTDQFYYTMDRDYQRSYNDGIVKHFDYSGLIVGSSMVDNFKTTIAEADWGVKFVKVPVSGATLKEINSYTKTALAYNPDTKIVICGLDIWCLLGDKDAWRDDIDMPYYLYDDNLVNDVKYLFNQDVCFRWVCPMIWGNITNPDDSGITSFDEYSNYMYESFGADGILPYIDKSGWGADESDISDQDAKNVRENVMQNITEIAEENPNVTFYYFITPCSVAWWWDQTERGVLRQYIEAERIAVEEMLRYPNIKCFSFNSDTDITADLDNYKDTRHYSDKVCDRILDHMVNDRYLLTTGNYTGLLEKEYELYSGYDYESLYDQMKN